MEEIIDNKDEIKQDESVIFTPETLPEVLWFCVVE